MSYNSKYTGQRVEELLDQVANGNAGGDIPDLSEFATLEQVDEKIEAAITTALNTEV